MALCLSNSPPKRKGGGVAIAGPEAESGVEALRRLDRRMKPFEQVGVLGLFVFTAAVFLLLLVCLLYSGYREGAVAVVAGRSWTWAMSGGAEECDWFEGEWVWDERYPLYNSTDCPFIDLGFRCSENGRPEDFYAKWRWQPFRCNSTGGFPRFDAKKMLEKLRGRRLVFVGDSIGRNQWESLICLLASVVPDKSSIYEVNGNPITKHMGFLIFRFRDYNCTIEYFRSPFLVVQGRAPARAPKVVKTTLRLDIIEWTSHKWKDADVLVFNSGHWWNFEKTIRMGCYFQVGDKVKMNMTVDRAYQRAIKTLIDWIHKEVNTSSTQVIFRTFSPSHFRSGDWKNGGSCHQEMFPDLGNLQFSLKPWAQFLNPFTNKNLQPEIEILNVTKMTAFRKDAHLSLFYLGPSIRASLYKQDCSHWCLPGVPDAWNELLYGLFMRRKEMLQRSATKNSTFDG